MGMHTYLVKKVSWYKRWHQKPYANLVHFAIFFLMLALNLILVSELKHEVNKSETYYYYASL